MTVRCKTFDSYIKELIYHPKRSPKWFADRRLTFLEKRILQGHLLVRENKNTQVIEELKNVAQSDIDFVRDHYYLLLGICYNNIGNHSEAEKFLNLAIKGFQEKDIHYHLFTSLFNILLVHSNRGKVQEMAPVLKLMEEICPDAKLAKIRLLRCQFIYAIDSNNEGMAKDVISKINKIKSEFSESDLGQHFVSEFMFYIQNEKFKDAQKVIDEMKKYRNYTSTDNYNFMKELLSHLTTDKTLYVYDREFPSQPVLYQQMKVIESFQGSHQEEAEKWWKMLQEVNPHLYQANFQYTGKKCLFSLCLDKHLKKKVTPLQVIKADKNKIQVVHEILKKSEVPIRKELLYELVYGEVAEDKVDLVKLANLISKVRNNYGSTISLRKGAYFLEKQFKRSSKSKVV